MANELVFKVKGVIGDALMRGDDPARAAIRAVAEWLDTMEAGWHVDAHNALLEQLEEDETP